jgi:Flp pilus assembly pilin Flp
MNKSNHVLNKFYTAGQGLVEYAILIALVALLAIFGLSIFGGSVKGGLIKVCAALGNEDCQSADTQVPPTPTATPAQTVVATATSIPVATPIVSEPEPTRGPVLVVSTTQPTPTAEMKTLRIKVVVSGGKSEAGITVVVYDSAGKYVTEGVTDGKGNVNLSVPAGSYSVSTLVNGTWQKDGPFSPGAKENVIHR